VVRSTGTYADSFGFQWERFARTQLDSRTDRFKISEVRIRECSGWTPELLRGQRVLEVGCGAGRFTEVLTRWGAEVVALDLSTAVYVARRNAPRGAVFARADAVKLPTAERFAFVFCYGVIQHTPAPEETFRSLADALAPGGRLSLDCYAKGISWEPYHAKYLWRWLTTRLPLPILYALVWSYVPLWLPVDTVLRRIPVIGLKLASIIPCFNWILSVRHLSWESVERTVLDTFDALSARYDKPQTRETLERWCKEVGAQHYSVEAGANGFVVNLTR
jgi:SAM-dependent methyltransferase